jgi:hypothetical protein
MRTGARRAVEQTFLEEQKRRTRRWFTNIKTDNKTIIQIYFTVKNI